MSNFIEDNMDFNEVGAEDKKGKVDKFANISLCKKYRYTLTRVFEETGIGTNLTFIMLNPSTADASIDDPTITRCMGFARREGAGELTVLNLFAYRATNPKELYKVMDPIGEGNDGILSDFIENCKDRKIICAWGTNGKYKNRDEDIINMAKKFKRNLYCLGTTKDGHPKHPLYIPKDQPIEIFKNNED